MANTTPITPPMPMPMPMPQGNERDAGPGMARTAQQCAQQAVANTRQAHQGR